jgi:hypothetical protein
MATIVYQLAYNFVSTLKQWGLDRARVTWLTVKQNDSDQRPALFWSKVSQSEGAFLGETHPLAHRSITLVAINRRCLRGEPATT